MGYSQKGLMLVWQYHPFLSGFLTNGDLPQLSSKSCLSTNEKGDNEVNLGAVHISPGIYIMYQEKPQKTSARRLSDEDRLTNHCLKWGPLLPNDGRITQHIKERERRKRKGKGGRIFSFLLHILLEEPM